MVELSKKLDCKFCNRTGSARLVRKINSFGSSLVYWECTLCNENAMGSAHWLPHDPIRKYGINIDEIPIVEDYRVQTCSVCGTLGAQLHHWAPRYLFGDEADKWPLTYLCVPCHIRWHNLVTPEMYKHRISDDEDRSIPFRVDAKITSG